MLVLPDYEVLDELTLPSTIVTSLRAEQEVVVPL